MREVKLSIKRLQEKGFSYADTPEGLLEAFDEQLKRFELQLAVDKEQGYAIQVERIGQEKVDQLREILKKANKEDGKETCVFCGIEVLPGGAYGITKTPSKYLACANCTQELYPRD